jgi:uncharacterized protein YutE (UPF0331/DUF86 family)
LNAIILNKKISIERCIKQIKTYYASDTCLPFNEDYLRQDAIAVNLQRICELSIDIANYIIKSKKLGLPQESRESFALLHEAGLISLEQMNILQGMVGFRNTLVHQYKKLDLNIMMDVIEHRMFDLLDFANCALKFLD